MATVTVKILGDFLPLLYPYSRFLNYAGSRCQSNCGFNDNNTVNTCGSNDVPVCLRLCSEYD